MLTVSTLGLLRTVSKYSDIFTILFFASRQETSVQFPLEWQRLIYDGESQGGQADGAPSGMSSGGGHVELEDGRGFGQALDECRRQGAKPGQGLEGRRAQLYVKLSLPSAPRVLAPVASPAAAAGAGGTGTMGAVAAKVRVPTAIGRLGVGANGPFRAAAPTMPGLELPSTGYPRGTSLDDTSTLLLSRPGVMQNQGENGGPGEGGGRARGKRWSLDDL